MQNISALLQSFSVCFIRRIGHGLLVFLILLSLFPVLQAQAEITTTEINGATGTEAINSRAQAGTTNSQGVLGFTECNYDNNRTKSRDASQFQECLKQVLRFTFVVGLFLIAIRIAMEAFASLNPFVSGQAAQRSVELVRDVVIGLVFIGAPVIFISLFNPAALNLNFLDLSFVPGNTRNPNAGTNADGSGPSTDTNGDGVIDQNDVVNSPDGTGGGGTGIGTGGGTGGNGSGTTTVDLPGGGQVRVDPSGKTTIINKDGSAIDLDSLPENLQGLGGLTSPGQPGGIDPLAQNQINELKNTLDGIAQAAQNPINDEQTLQRERELQERLKKGDLSKEQVQSAQDELDQIAKKKEGQARAMETLQQILASEPYKKAVQSATDGSIISEVGQTELEKCFRLGQKEITGCNLQETYFVKTRTLLGEVTTPTSSIFGQPINNFLIVPTKSRGMAMAPAFITFRLEGTACQNTPFFTSPDSITGNIGVPGCQMHLMTVSKAARENEETFYQ